MLSFALNAGQPQPCISRHNKPSSCRTWPRHRPQSTAALFSLQLSLLVPVSVSGGDVQRIRIERRQVMKRWLIVLSLLSAAFVTLTIQGLARADSQSAAVAKAEKAARPWLALVDAARFSKSWETASITFRLGVTEEKWKESLQQVQGQTGSLKSRSLLHSEYTTSLPGGPAGEYVVIQYNSAFTKGSYVETLVMMLDGGKWKAAGYFVKPA